MTENGEGASSIDFLSTVPGQLSAAGNPMGRRFSNTLRLNQEVFPFAEIPEGLASSFGGTTEQTSTIVVCNVAVANAAAAFAIAGPLARGLWHVHLTCDYVSNYSVLAAGFPEGRVNWAPDSTLNFAGNVAFFLPVANVAQNKVLNFTVLVARDGWTLQAELAANGVGQAHRLCLAAVCNRLV